MSLLTKVQSESYWRYACNLDTSTSPTIRSGYSVTPTTYGTVSQNSASITGNGSYDFSSGRVQYQTGNSGGWNDFAFEFVFKKSSKPSSGNAEYLLAQPTNTTGGAVNGIYIDSNGYINTNIKAFSTNPSLVNSVDLCDDKWHHVIVSYMGITGGYRLYVDGTLAASTNSAGNTGAYGIFNLGSYLAQDLTTAGSYFNGLIDFFAQYDGQYSNSEMDAIAASHVAEYANRTVAAAVSTASGLMTTAVPYSNTLVAEALGDQAAYVFPLDTTITQVLGGAMTGGRTFSTPLNSATYRAGRSATGGTGSWEIADTNTVGNEIQFLESTTPNITHEKGLSVEFAFYYPAYAANDTGRRDIMIKNWSNGGWGITLEGNSGTNYISAGFSNPAYVQHSTALVPGRWYHVVAQWNPTDDYTYLTINNVTETSANKNTGSGNNFAGSNYFNIGADSGLSMDFIAFYSSVYNGKFLSSAEIGHHYDTFEAARYIQQSKTIVAEPMTASGSIPKAALIIATPVTAFATAVHPSAVIAVINKTVNVTPLTASALLDPPVITSGTSHGAAHMNASASMGQESEVFILGIGRGNPMIAVAGITDPTVTTQLSALIRPQSLNASMFLPLPPAYIQLTDDPYFVRLFDQHATIFEERVFQGASNVAGANPLTPKDSFLKFFSDISKDIKIGSTDYLQSELPDYVFDRPGTVYYDSDGNIYPAPTTKRSIQASGKTTATPTPVLSKGYFDDYQRPAVRFNNIEFTYPENQYITEKPYTLEFTIKTTKANQIIAKGRWNSYQYNQWHTGTIGLFEGKLYGMSTFQNIGQGEIVPHPINAKALAKAGLNAGYMLSDIRLDDGQWHHVIVQYGYQGDSRAQFWIDGELDKQIIDGYSAPGYNGRMVIRPFIFGSSSTDAALQSDFLTSVWSYDPGGFLSYGDAKLNYIAYTKSVPIEVGPMTADVTITQNHKAIGNRTRALMLYFWPEGDNIATSSYAPQMRKPNDGWGGEFDIITLDGFSTNDYYRTPPEQWLEWDIFPVDVTGQYLSDVIKPEAYGGEENARLQSPSVALSGEVYDARKYERKINTRGYFRDDNDDFRYIDLVKDIDLSQFDVIMFKNFPDDGIEQDIYSKNAEVDRYLSLTTRTLYERFLESLREAVDTGISLLVTNPQLAIDLGIVDRLEPLPDQKQFYQDPGVQEYEYSLLPDTAPEPDSTGFYQDSHYMSKIRVVNTVEGMTDYPVGIRTDKALWQNDGLRDFTGTDQTWERVEWRPNGLQVNDEFEVMVQPTSTYPLRSAILWSAPFENVKAGTIVTAWQNQIRQGETLVNNAYKNYASSIIVKPGDVLNGKQVGGKIFVDLMHSRLKDSEDYASIDLNKISWINIAEQMGAITAADATALRASGETLENKYPNQNSEQYIKRAYWTHNDSDYAVLGGQQVTLNKALNIGQVALAGKRASNRKGNYNNRVIDAAFGQFTGGGQLWFTIRYTYVMDTFALWTPTISSLGILWLSERELVPEQFTNHTAQTASATLVQPRIIVDKVSSITVSAMIALATVTNAVGKTPNDVLIATLPLTANATINASTRMFYATPMGATAKIATNFQTVTRSIDEVIVYIDHVDPILYLREDIIK